MSEELLVNVTEACRRLGIGRSSIYEEFRTGALESVQIGNSRRVPVVALESYVRRLREIARSEVEIDDESRQDKSPSN